jgi:hypothetical protein
MGNVNLPTPVAVAGGALCLLAGYLIGAVSGPDTTSRTTGEVESYDGGSDELCLRGKAVEDQPGAESGRLCGQWRHSPGDDRPREGDAFRFVSVVTSNDTDPMTYIYGSVVGE